MDICRLDAADMFIVSNAVASAVVMWRSDNADKASETGHQYGERITLLASQYLSVEPFNGVVSATAATSGQRKRLAAASMTLAYRRRAAKKKISWRCTAIMFRLRISHVAYFISCRGVVARQNSCWTFTRTFARLFFFFFFFFSLFNVRKMRLSTSLCHQAWREGGLPAALPFLPWLARD